MKFCFTIVATFCIGVFLHQEAQGQVRNEKSKGFFMEVVGLRHGKPLDGDHFYDSYFWQSTAPSGANIGIYTPIGLIAVGGHYYEAHGTGEPIERSNHLGRFSDYYYWKLQIELRRLLLRKPHFDLYTPLRFSAITGTLQATVIGTDFYPQNWSTEVFGFGPELGLGVSVPWGRHFSFAAEFSFFFGRYSYRGYHRTPSINPRLSVEINPISLSFRFHPGKFYRKSGVKTRRRRKQSAYR